LNPRPTYHGKSYDSDYTEKPFAALKRALAGTLKGYVGGKEVPRNEWLDTDVWDRLEVKFFGEDVRRSRAKDVPISKAASPKRLSRVDAETIYDEIQRRRGAGTPPLGVRKVWESAKQEPGFTWERLKIIHAKRYPGVDRGRKKNPPTA
jgi:hypothetical protein